MTNASCSEQPPNDLDGEAALEVKRSNLFTRMISSGIQIYMLPFPVAKSTYYFYLSVTLTRAAFTFYGCT